MPFFLRRLGFYAVALWASVTVNFFLPRLQPGNPLDAFIAQYQGQLATNPHLLDTLKAQFPSPKDPLPVQYIHYLGNLAHLDFGISYSQFPERVNDIVGQTLPYSLLLAGLSTVLAFGLGTLLGVVASWWRGRLLDTAVTSLTMATAAFPPFFVAMLVLYGLGVLLGWFPLSHVNSSGVTPSFSPTYVLDTLDHAAMPLLALLLAALGGWLLAMRSVMINILAEDYITMAQAKGLSTRRVMFTYAARNALLPQVTSFAIVLGYSVTSLVLIEDVFSYPGLGFTMVRAVGANDYPLMQAIFFLIVVVMLAANLVADLLYARLDPRVRAFRGA
jgi:peptide/nickel transport system permease protein